jgi:hypothetical protein
MIPGRNQSASVKYAIAVSGFFDLDGALLVQTIRECPREYFGHVLDDDDAGARGGHRLQEFA